MFTVVSRLKSAKERAKGLSAGVKLTALTATSQSSFNGRRHSSGRWHAIVDDNAGDAECLLHLCKGTDYIVGLSEVAGDVQLVVGAVGLLDGAGGKADLVALGGKEAGDGMANIGTGAEYEDDRGLGGHYLVLGRYRISFLRGGCAWSCLNQ